MTVDIVPELITNIRKDFNSRVRKSTNIKSIINKINGGNADYADAQNYAREIGSLLSQAMNTHITKEILPDGRMYYNIADRVLGDTLKYDYEIVTNATQHIQVRLNEKAGLGLKAVKPAPNFDRIKGLVNKISSEEDFDNVSWLLGDPVINYSQAIVDESVRANARFHSLSGLRPTITRSMVSETCGWCESLVGTYYYEDVQETGNPVFMRHRNCDCLVVYDPGDGRKQDSHTKKWL